MLAPGGRRLEQRLSRRYPLGTFEACESNGRKVPAQDFAFCRRATAMAFSMAVSASLGVPAPAASAPRRTSLTIEPYGSGSPPAASVGCLVIGLHLLWL
jgi:hypothetical protein